MHIAHAVQRSNARIGAGHSRSARYSVQARTTSAPRRRYLFAGEGGCIIQRWCHIMWSIIICCIGMY